MAELSLEAQKVLDARRSAVEELKAIDGAERNITDPDVIRLANARLFEAAITMRVIAGEPVSAAEIKAADDMVQAARGTTQKPIKVEVRIVAPVDATSDGSGVDGLKECRRCGWSPPEGDHASRCWKCGWKTGDDTSGPWERGVADAKHPLPQPFWPMMK